MPKEVHRDWNVVADLGAIQILEEGKAFELGKIMHSVWYTISNG